MKNLTRTIVVVFAALASGAALSGTPIPAAAHETSTKAITLPAEIGGDAILHACTACPTLRLATNDKTVFRIGDVPVSLAAMRLELKRRPEGGALVRATPDDRVLVALVIPSQP